MLTRTAPRSPSPAQAIMQLELPGTSRPYRAQPPPSLFTSARLGSVGRRAVAVSTLRYHPLRLGRRELAQFDSDCLHPSTIPASAHQPSDTPAFIAPGYPAPPTPSHCQTAATAVPTRDAAPRSLKHQRSLSERAYQVRAQPPAPPRRHATQPPLHLTSTQPRALPSPPCFRPATSAGNRSDRHQPHHPRLRVSQHIINRQTPACERDLPPVPDIACCRL
ncbi:hypothetical protein V8E36_005025 [Tilletia maclaganii]